MKLITYKELGEKVADQALDEYLINGKTLREWINILSENMSLLEQIRAEIQALYDDSDDEWNDMDERYAYQNCLQIIDKYTKGEDE